jgi:hypothetical protein
MLTKRGHKICVAWSRSRGRTAIAVKGRSSVRAAVEIKVKSLKRPLEIEEIRRFRYKIKINKVVVIMLETIKGVNTIEICLYKNYFIV